MVPWFCSLCGAFMTIIYAIDFAIAAAGLERLASTRCTPWDYELVYDECLFQTCNDGSSGCAASVQPCVRCKFLCTLSGLLADGSTASLLALSSPEGSYRTEAEADVDCKGLVQNGTTSCFYDVAGATSLRLDLRIMEPIPPTPATLPVLVFGVGTLVFMAISFVCVAVPERVCNRISTRLEALLSCVVLTCCNDSAHDHAVAHQDLELPYARRHIVHNPMHDT
jgi:hypothetical protein